MTTMAEAVAAGRQHGADAKVGIETGKNTRVAKNLLLLIAAPWIGLAYVIAFPFIGTAVLVKTILQA